MAYNTSKGDRQLGDIKNEDDIDTRLDWEDDYIGLKTGGTTRLAISGSAGNVGIGTVNPSHTLQIDSNSGVEGIQINGAQNQYVASFRANTTTGQSYGPYVRGGTNSSDAALIVDNAAGTTSLLKLTGEGKLGIGIASPTHKLTVDGTISGSGNVKIDGSISASADVYVTGAVSANAYYGDGSNLTGISAGSVSGSGRIYSTTGIETSGYLNVTGNIDSAGDLTAATITMNGFVVDADGDTNLKSLRVDDGSFVGCDSDTDLMRLSSNTLQINGALSGSSTIYAASSISSSLNLAVTGAVHANTYYGDGSNLTGVSAGSVSGSARIYSSTGVETSGYLKVTGSSTFAGAATFNSTLTASQGLILSDNKSASFGNSGDFRIRHDSTNTKLTNATGHVLIDNQATSKDIRFILGSDSAATEAVKIRNNSDNNVWICDAAGNVSGSGKLETVGNAFVVGNLNVTGNIDTAADLTAATITMSGFVVDSDGDTNLKSLRVDDGSFIGCDSDTDLMRLTTNTLQLNGALSGSGIIYAVNSISSSGDLAVTGAIHANTYYGDGSNLTGLSTGVSGSARVYSSTGLETSGYLKVTGSSTLAAITATTYSGSSTIECVSHGRVGGDLNVSGSAIIGVNAATKTIISGMLTASQGIYMADNRSASFGDAADFSIKHNGTDSLLTNANGHIFIHQQSDGDDIKLKLSTTTSTSDVRILNSSDVRKHVFDAVGNISSSLNLQASSASFNGDLAVSGTIRGKQIHITQHAYDLGTGGERWIPFYNISDAALGSATYINQMAAPFSGRLLRIIFRPEASDCGDTTIILYKQSDGTQAMHTSRTYCEQQTVACAAAAATSNVFNFTGSSHFSQGEVIGVTIDPINGPDNANVTCVWEYDMFGV